MTRELVLALPRKARHLGKKEDMGRIRKGRHTQCFYFPMFLTSKAVSCAVIQHRGTKGRKWSMGHLGVGEA